MNHLPKDFKLPKGIDKNRKFAIVSTHRAQSAGGTMREYWAVEIVVFMGAWRMCHTAESGLIYEHHANDIANELADRYKLEVIYDD